MYPELPSQVTNGIRITVQTAFVEEQSNADNHHYAFVYRIYIRNESGSTVQLLRRHWEILDGYSLRRVVRGDGVVGRQPVIAPGTEHHYVSGSVFATPIGRMQGHYVMWDSQSEEEFEVEIPPFLLVAPYLLN
jgi:ApaG protein